VYQAGVDMAMYTLGTGLVDAVIDAGLGGSPFAWDMAGNLYLGEGLTEAQISAIEATAAAYKPAA
jgi:hypothetical protein